MACDENINDITINIRYRGLFILRKDNIVGVKAKKKTEKTQEKIKVFDRNKIINEDISLLSLAMVAYLTTTKVKDAGITAKRPSKDIIATNSPY